MKKTSLIVLVCSLMLCLSVPLLSQGTFTVYLPEHGNPSNVDSIIVPNGRPIYALLVSGYGRNGNFDELHFYNFAREIMAHGGYVHYAWWNNLLAPYMERPLHSDQSYPGDILDNLASFTDPNGSKALPGEDCQFVSDARKFLSAVQENNPNAIIIVVGHSMGAGAIIHLANTWTTVWNGRIDILAPIDPVGNRNWPWAGNPLRILANDFNWTRWRTTRDFFGYKRFKDFDPRPLFEDCQPDGDWIPNYNTAKDLNDPQCGNQPYIHPPVNTYTFNENVVHLYHRWQTEFLFPFDYLQNYTFGHTRPAGGSTYQAKVNTTPEMCGVFPNRYRCVDVDGWPEGYNPSTHGCCTPNGIGVGWAFDGHGEIVGYRGPITNGGPVPLAVRVGTSPNCGLCPDSTWPWRYKQNGAWVDPNSSNRKSILIGLESLPTLYWEHSPQRPQNCLVSDGLISLFNSTNYTISQWSRQSSGTSKLLRSVFFTDINNGWVVGDDGLIKHTTDGGNTWNLQSSSTSNNITDVYFSDASTGWVVGSGGLIKHTSDGGNTWDLQSSGTSKTIYGVYFTDTNTGWVVGNDGLIKHTTDGGNTWNLQSSGTSKNITDVYFTDANTGWVVGNDGLIKHTTDGGNTWPFLQPSGTSKNITAVYFTDASTGWVVGNDGLIKHTTDGGDTWPFLQPSGTSRDLTDVSFIDANMGWVVGSGGLITHTSDGGTTWNLQITGRLNNLESVYFTDANTGWAVGWEGLILHTTNGGVTFVEEEEIHEMPTDYNLSQNYPNPFNPSTKIRYSVPQALNVEIKVFDILGREVETLVNEEKLLGTYELNWNAANLPSGIYFYRLQAGSFVETKKMMLLK